MDSRLTSNKVSNQDLDLQMLTYEQVAYIDKLLKSVDGYGEIRLIVKKRELKFIQKVESYKAWDYHGNEQP
jgi:hypothetical protein